MLFRLANTWFPLCASAFAFAIGPSLAFGQTILESRPALPYTMQDGGSGITTAWFAGETSAVVPVPMDTNGGFRYFNFLSGQITPSVEVKEDALFFDIEISGTPPAGQDLLVLAKAADFLAPIAYAGTTSSTTRCVPSGTLTANECYSGVVNAPSTTVINESLRWAARYTGASIIRIGIFPADICAASNAAGSAQLAFCTTAARTVNVPSATGAASIPFTFYLSQVPTGQATPALPVPSTLTGGDAITARLVAYPAPGPSIVPCPSPTTRYKLQDGGIDLDTTIFASTGTATNGPGISSIIALAKLSPGTPDTLNFANNDVIQRPIVSGYQRVDGLTNSGTAGVFSYNFVFATRESTGVTSTFGCALNGVQTADIQGFLNGDKCFIATAAFGSREAIPVKMLRRFRDRVLLTVGPGRVFVAWYYANSPRWAQWLEERPMFRVPALFMLTPLEIVAWVFLRPLLALGLALMGMTAVAWAVTSRFPRMRAGAPE